MRIASGPVGRTLLAALVAWSAAGVQVDLASGPLTPEAALGAICDLALPPNEVAEPAPVASPTASPSSEPTPDCPSAVTEANWPLAAFTHFPARALVKRIVAPSQAIARHLPSYTALAEMRDAPALDAASLPLRLCRLHC